MGRGNCCALGLFLLCVFLFLSFFFFSVLPRLANWLQPAARYSALFVSDSFAPAQIGISRWPKIYSHFDTLKTCFSRFLQAINFVLAWHLILCVFQFQVSSFLHIVANIVSGYQRFLYYTHTHTRSRTHAHTHALAIDADRLPQLWLHLVNVSVSVSVVAFVSVSVAVCSNNLTTAA